MCVLFNVVTHAKEAVGRRDVRRSHRENAECRLSTAPLAGCRLPSSASLHQAEARCGDLQPSAVVHRLWNRAAAHYRALAGAAVVGCLCHPCLTRSPTEPEHESCLDDWCRPIDGQSCLRPPPAGYLVDAFRARSSWLTANWLLWTGVEPVTSRGKIWCSTSELPIDAAGLEPSRGTRFDDGWKADRARRWSNGVNHACF